MTSTNFWIELLWTKIKVTQKCLCYPYIQNFMENNQTNFLRCKRKERYDLDIVSLFISLFNQLDAQHLFHSKFYFMSLHVSSICAYHQEVKIALHSLWYHHTYRSDDTRGCVMQFWPPDDKHMCSKHVETWNKTLWNKFYTSIWLNTEINKLRCTVSKTSKKLCLYFMQFGQRRTKTN